jgi:hypothetical protein
MLIRSQETKMEIPAHVSIVEAITQREGPRAEALFREHAYRSRENQHILLQAMKQQSSTTPHRGSSWSWGSETALPDGIMAISLHGCVR